MRIRIQRNLHTCHNEIIIIILAIFLEYKYIFNRHIQFMLNPSASCSHTKRPTRTPCVCMNNMHTLCFGTQCVAQCARHDVLCSIVVPKHERLDYRNKCSLFDHQFKRSLKNDKYAEKDVRGQEKILYHIFIFVPFRVHCAPDGGVSFQIHRFMSANVILSIRGICSKRDSATRKATVINFG